MNYTNKQNLLSTSDIVLHYNTHNRNPHYFAPATMEYFKSRLHDPIRKLNDSRYFFITSEKGPVPLSKRKYSIREYNIDTARIKNISAFCEYATLDKAIAAMTEYTLCEACDDIGYLAVCIGVSDDGKSDIWENQWCQNCHITMPEYDPPELEDDETPLPLTVEE